MIFLLRNRNEVAIFEVWWLGLLLFWKVSSINICRYLTVVLFCSFIRWQYSEWIKLPFNNRCWYPSNWKDPIFFLFFFFILLRAYTHFFSRWYLSWSIARDTVRRKKMRHRGCRPGDQQLTFATNHHHMSFSLYYSPLSVCSRVRSNWLP